MLLRRLVALSAAALAVLPLASSSPATGREEAPHGAAGIGDPYFPLDGNGGIDVRSYDIHDRYRFREGRLSGWTAVTLRATETLSTFNLDFLLPVRAVSVDGRAAGFDKTHHELVVRHPVTAGDVVRVVVRYSGRPGRYSYAGESNWLADGHEVVAMNQPHMAPWWFPANDHPLDKARVRMSITVPKTKQVIGNGRRVERTVRGGLATTTWQSAEPMVPYLAFFAAGSYEVAHGRADGRPWYVAVSDAYPDARQREAMQLLRRSAEVVHWIEGVLGADYPFSTTGGVATALEPYFALENQTRPTYSPLSLDFSTMVHELSHQWFGDSVAVESWSDIWLNEGTATFFEWYYREEHGGPGAQSELLDSYSYDADDRFWKLEVADPCSADTECVQWIFDSRVYQRGAMTLQALRNRIGNADFFDLLRRWVTDHAGGNGSTEQFEALAEQVSGQDLGGFFDAWVHATTKPADTAANGLG